MNRGTGSEGRRDIFLGVKKLPSYYDNIYSTGGKNDFTVVIIIIIYKVLTAIEHFSGIFEQST